MLATALLAGAIAVTFIMLWLGKQFGLSGYSRDLASSPNGTLFNSSLGFGAKSALVSWPLSTAIVVLIAEWSTRPAPRRAR